MRGVLALCLLFIALTIAIAARAAPYVGAYSDDAAYIANALALLHGHFSDPSALYAGIHNQYWPGYSLALAPWVALVKPHWSLLRIPSIGAMLLAGLLLTAIARRYVRGWPLIVICAAFFLHPLTLNLAPAVLSEPLFTACVLFFFIGLDRQLKAPTLVRLVGLAVLLGATVLVRPTGVALYGGVVAAYVALRRYREGLTLTAVSLAVWGFFPLCQTLVMHQPPVYVGLWRTSWTFFAGHVGHHLARIFVLLFGHAILGARLPHTPTATPWACLGAALAALICAWGIRDAWRRVPEQRGLTCAMAGFVLAYVLLHGLYLSIDTRYFLPVLPCTLFFFALGGIALSSHLTPLATRCAGILWLVALFWPDGRLLAGAWHGERPLEARLPGQTLQWIRSHVPTDAAVLGRQPFLYLYTGLRGIDVIPASNSSDFTYALLQRHIAYAVFTPGGVNMPLRAYPRQSSAWALVMTRHYILERPRVFHQVYANPDEQTLVFKVQPDPSFMRAYANYLDGTDALRAGQWRDAKAKLEASLHDDPSLSDAWTAYGLWHYERGDYAAAAVDFQRALALDPEDILANLHAARVERLRHADRAAAASYQRAIDTIEASGDYADLLPQIHAEQNALR